MTTQKKVIYYNMPGELHYEHELLKQWGIEDLELVQVFGNDLIEDVKDADSLTLEYITVDSNVLQSLPNLKIIALQYIGTDDIDIDSADQEGIYVTNAPGFCAHEVATHVMALILNLNRKINFFSQRVKQGHWDPFEGGELHRLKGQTCGLVSLGSIPQALIPMLQGFGINVVFLSQSKTTEYADQLGIKKCNSLGELLAVSDIVSLHSPLTPETQHMMNEDTFSKMKQGAIFINSSRGGLVDEKALIKSLQSGKVLAAGLDVLEDETNHDSELTQVDNVIVTPHVGFLSEESLRDSKRMALEQIVARLSKGEKPILSVNKNMKSLRN
ncbi:C-terminal binding protein [Marinomonas sp.]|nr:C-terminal binding protein [Marinomonas sp.]MDB4836852.1 C-terminal binding protein [Marinomonas sp.]